MTFQVEEIHNFIRSSFKTHIFFFYNDTTKVIYFALKIPYMRWHYFFFYLCKPFIFFKKFILIGS